MRQKFTTERLELKLVEEIDHAFIQKLLNSKGWLEFIGDRNIHTEEDAVNYIKRIIQSPYINYWIVRLKATNEAIGMVSFIKRDYLDHYDIGFAFLPEYAGMGYAFEAASVVMGELSKLPAYKTITGITVAENSNSIRLLKKLGLHFEKEITVKDEVLQLYIINYK